LRCVSGPRRGQEFISSGPRIRIGRSRDNDIILVESESPPSSGRHAEALAERGAWWIVDAGSTNGTYVNGVAVDRRRLKTGDVLTFGDDQFVVAGSRGPLWLALAAVAALAVAGAAAYTTRKRAPPIRTNRRRGARPCMRSRLRTTAGERSSAPHSRSIQMASLRQMLTWRMPPPA
jgi:hypothetical protein